MTPYEKAYQRAARLMQAGIYNQATKAFDLARKAITASRDLSKAEKKEARNEIARAFIESGASTKTDIEQTFQGLNAPGKMGKVDRLAKTAGFSKAEKAAYIDASDTAAAIMTIKALKGSGYINNLAQQLGDDPDMFYEAVWGAVDAINSDPDISVDDLNDLIPDYY